MFLQVKRQQEMFDQVAVWVLFLEVKLQILRYNKQYLGVRKLQTRCDSYI